jgi:hypothetical protein
MYRLKMGRDGELDKVYKENLPKDFATEQS